MPETGGLFEDQPGLFFFVVGLSDRDPFSPAVFSPEFFFHPSAVVADDRIGRFQDDLGRAVTLVERDDLRALERRLEVGQVRRVGMTPRVDRLVGIANDTDVPALQCEQPCDLELERVGVLELVDQQVLVSLLVLFEDLRIAFQQHERLEQKVVEVDRVCPLQCTLVCLVNTGCDLFSIGLGAFSELCRAPHIVLGVGHGTQ